MVTNRKDIAVSALSLTNADGDDVDGAAEARQLELAALRSELAAQYRDELFALRRERQAAGGGGPATGGNPWLDDKAEKDVHEFIKSLNEKKEQRIYQLSLIKEYLVDPSKFGPQSDVIPTSTTIEEFEERKKELSFRIALLRTLLALAEEEQKMLLRAEAYTRSEGKDEPSPESPG